MTTATLPDPHEVADEGFAYAGKVYFGKEAAYLRTATGHAIRSTQVPSARLTRDESVALLAAQLARDGIPFQTWTRWTVDQMDLYLEGRALRVQQVNDEIHSMEANAKANQSEILLRYVVPLD